MKLEILQNSDEMGKKRILDLDSATRNYMETSGFVSGQKIKLILLTCVDSKLNESNIRESVVPYNREKKSKAGFEIFAKFHFVLATKNNNSI